MNGSRAATLALLAIGAGCGRVGFDVIAGRGDADNLGGDATLDAPADASTAVVLVSDDFMRTTANAWGDADIGGTWTIYNPNGSMFSVGNSGALATLTAANAYADFHVSSATAVDGETRTVASFDHVPAAGATGWFISVRWRGNGTAYSMHVELAPTGNVQVWIRRYLPGGTVDITPVAVGLTGIAANERVAGSLRATGLSPTQLCGRVWRDGTAEPTACTVTVADGAAALQGPGISYLAAYDAGGGVPTTIAFALFRYLRVGPQ